MAERKIRLRGRDTTPQDAYDALRLTCPDLRGVPEDGYPDGLEVDVRESRADGEDVNAYVITWDYRSCSRRATLRHGKTLVEVCGGAFNPDGEAWVRLYAAEVPRDEAALDALLLLAGRHNFPHGDYFEEL